MSAFSPNVTQPPDFSLQLIAVRNRGAEMFFIVDKRQPLHPLAPQHPLWCQRGNAAAPHGGIGGATYIRELADGAAVMVATAVEAAASETTVAK